MDELEIELHDTLYVVGVESFTWPRPYRWDESPDLGEIELEDDVLVIPEQGDRFRIPLTTFEQLWGAANGVAPRFCRDRLADRCYEMYLKQQEDQFDDR